MHIYHYAAYEVSAVRRLSTRHDTRQDQVDELLRHDVFIDLYQIVGHGLRIGEDSYSIKKVERLYRPKRATNVATAVDSIVQYARWIESKQPGEWAKSPILKGIRDYNEDDCKSTAELLIWLRKVAAENKISAARKIAAAAPAVPPVLPPDVAARLNTGARLAGLPQTASERAFDMFLKVRHVQSLNGGGGVVFATGTPIANSMAEMFTMQRYLQHDELKKHNLHHFDSWAATFGEPVTAMELSPDGAGYRLNTRFARFINVPELMQMFRQSADVQTAAMLNLPRPKLDGEKPTIRNAPATEELKAFVQSLAARAERLKNGRVDPSEDNMLKITSEGRKAALDLRLMKPAAPDEPQGKVNLAVEKIFNIWQESKPERSAQLVFCDLSTPKDKGFSVYNDMAQKLEKLGIPSSEIAFIQDHDSDASKLTLFRDVRSGKVRVLFGSTQKMGSGTNVQERLIALHHLDAPWRPADVEQREGRILRQGNKNAVVQVSWACRSTSV